MKTRQNLCHAILLIFHSCLIKNTISSDDTDVRGDIHIDQQNASVLLDELNWETIEERCVKNAHLKEFPTWHLPNDWKPDASFLPSIRNLRKEKYMTKETIGENHYFIELSFPINFSDIELSDQENIFNSTKLYDERNYSQVKNKLEDNKIYNKDHFLYCMKVIHTYLFDKLELNNRMDEIIDKTYPHPKSNFNRNITQASFNYTQICALNWLINYFSKDYVFGCAFIFPRTLCIGNEDDTIISIKIEFDFDLPELQNISDTCKRKFIELLNNHLFNSHSDLILTINDNYTKNSIHQHLKNNFSEDLVDIKTLFMFNRNCMDFIKLIITYNTYFTNHFNDLWLDQNDKKRSYKQFQISKNYNIYCKYFENLNFKIVQLKKDYNINKCLFSCNEIGINELSCEVNHLKIKCEKMLLLTYRLYVYSVYRRVFVVCDEIDVKNEIIKKLSNENLGAVDIFNKSLLYTDFNNFRDTQTLKLIKKLKNLNTISKLKIFKNIGNKDIKNIQQLLQKQKDYFEFLMNHLSFDDNKRMKFNDATKETIQSNKFILDKSGNDNKFNNLQNFFQLFPKKYDFSIRNIVDSETLGVISNELNVFETEEILKIYNCLADEKSALFCLYQKVATVLCSFLSDANETTLILNKLKIN